MNKIRYEYRSLGISPGTNIKCKHFHTIKNQKYVHTTSDMYIHHLICKQTKRSGDNRMLHNLVILSD